MVNSTDRRDYNIAASQNAQDNFNRVASQLESLIDQRDRDVSAAMSDYAADGVSEDYRAVELRWKNAAGEVRGIIAALRQTLELDDGHAADALKKARAAVESVG